jgi:uroporphyrinogen-III decarboxylase
MNSTARLKAALRSEPVDRVPVVPKIWVDFAAINTDTSLLDVVRDPLTALNVIARVGSQLGVDAVRQFPFQARRLCKEDGKVFEVEQSGRKLGQIDIQGGLGTRLFDAEDYHIEDPVTIAYCHNRIPPRPVVNSIKDARRIAVPQKEIFDELQWASNQRVIAKRYPEMCLIGDCDSATLSFYLAFRGIEIAMLDLVETPKLVHAVMEKGAAVAISRGKYWIDHGINILRLNDSTGNMSLISPQQWKELIFPHMRVVCDELHRYHPRTLVYCHICGNILPIADLLVETGLDCIGPLDPLGGFTVAQMRAKVGDRVSLMGGVNTLTLLQKTPQDVQREASECIRGAGTAGGFVLGSGCVVPRHSPQENIAALVQAAKDFALNGRE